MTIQLSVLIWTIICFCLLMLILNKLLFKPLLSVMDARQEKIDKAREKKESHARLYAQAEKDMEEHRALQEKQWADNAAAEVASARSSAQAQLEEAQKQSEQELEAYRQALASESAELKSKLDAGVEALASTFADRLLS